MKSIFITLLISIFSIIGLSSSVAQENQELKKTTIRVRNMHCNGDMPTIKAELLKQDGVMDVSFSDRKMEMAVFTIQYHEGAVDRGTLEKAIENTPGCDDKSTKPYRVIKEKEKKEKGK